MHKAVALDGLPNPQAVAVAPVELERETEGVTVIRGGAPLEPGQAAKGVLDRGTGRLSSA